MIFVETGGLWTSSPINRPAPLAAVVELGGAVLSFQVDDSSTPAEIAFTDAEGADWLWRLFGEAGHRALVGALAGARGQDVVDVAGIDADPGAMAALRRLALGHWLRRWWPASRRDGIAALNGALLDAEIALLTVTAQDYFSVDTLDSDVARLLEPHAGQLWALEREGDPRVVALCRSCADLIDDVAPSIDVSTVARGPERDDYALAAGATAPSSAPAVALGVDSISWAAVPPGVFDAADDTVHWRVTDADPNVDAVVRAELLGGGLPTDIPVRLVSGDFRGGGVLTSDGTATLSLVDVAGRPLRPAAAWNHDWRATEVTVGASVDESAGTRAQVRDVARARLDRPGPDAFLAEIIAAESNY